MPTKTKTAKRRTRTKKLPAGKKNISGEQKKRVKGGSIPGNAGQSVFTITTPSSRFTVSGPVYGASAELLASELSAASHATA